MKILKHILIILLAAFTYSCHEELDLTPPSDYEDDNYGRNTEEVNTLVMGCYAGMRKPLETEWMMTELRSDNSLQGSTGSTSTSNLNLNYLDMFSVSSTHPSVYDYWYYTYQNIDNTNRVLKKIDNVTDSTLRKQYQSEALFVRSYHFFNLVRLFGPIFLPTESLTPVEAKLQNRVATPAVYAQIIADLKLASLGLPASYGAQDLGRASTWAAKGLLAKVYLTIDSIEQAKVQLEDIVNNSSHRLLGDYAEVFSTNNEVNKEIVFTIRFKAGGVGQGSSFANWFAASSSGSNIVNGGGSGLNSPSANLNGAYEASDTRRDVNIGRYVSGSTSRLYVKKYVSYVKTRYDAENDWPVLRYSDILLMHAEAKAKISGPSAGMAELNQVRQRANASLYGSIVSINDFMDLIYKERRLELAFENDRWFDMVRSGKAITIIKDHININEAQHYNNYSTEYDAMRNKMKNIQSWQLLLPIPQREIDTNNQIQIAQNFGY